MFLLTFVFTIPFLTPFQKYLSIPNEIITVNNETPITVPSIGDAVHISTVGQTDAYSSLSPNDIGNHHIFYEIAGMPIKKVNVSLVEDIQIVPGGQSIGVQLHTLGVLVVGHHLVKGENGMISPGEDAQIKVGDIILQMNEQPIEKMEDVKPIVEEAGKNNDLLNLKLKRGTKTIETNIRPVLNQQEKEYQIGLYIRDSAAGIGTMSFYEPVTKRYGALGHVISDMDTNKPIEIHNGTIVRSRVTAIEKGVHGSPGEKQANFSVNRHQIGSITKNSPFGIFGQLSEPIKNNIYDEPMSIALSHEVVEGPAKILTVLEDEKVEEFDVEIVSSIPQEFPATKGMVIRVTDPVLLEKTGGIVQGMSGSPIIQNNKIIGAITHVFVNDPTSGYGVHIEWMLQETGIHIKQEENKAS